MAAAYQLAGFRMLLPGIESGNKLDSSIHRLIGRMKSACSLNWRDVLRVGAPGVTSPRT
jgi:hypothetical protein